MLINTKDFLESKYNAYRTRTASKQYTANTLSDDELCECIESAPDWEVCEAYGLLNELARRADMIFDYDGYSWESDIDKAIEKLRSSN